MSELRRDNLGWLLAKASQRWNQRLEEGFRNAGFASVRPSFGSVLVPLYEEDGLTMGELARRSGLSKQAMTTLVRAVEEAGFVTRERDAADATGVPCLAQPRGAGAASCRGASPRRPRRGARGAVSSAAELEHLADALRKVAET